MQKILVPTDFSKDALDALMVAAQLAKKNNSIIYLLHVLELPSHFVDQLGGNNSSNMPEAIMFMKGVHQRFEQLSEIPELKDIEVREVISSEPFTEGVVNKCKEHDIDLIIMGSHGTEKNTGIFIGSNTEKIVRISPKPVLVIKENTDIEQTHKIVFASEFTDDEIYAANSINSFASEIDATIHLLYVNTPKNFYTNKLIEEKMLTFINQSELKNFSLNIYNDTTVENGILNFSNGIDANLICVGTHERKGINQFINNSLSNDLVHHTNKPILAYPLDILSMNKKQAS